MRLERTAFGTVGGRWTRVAAWALFAVWGSCSLTGGAIAQEDDASQATAQDDPAGDESAPVRDEPPGFYMGRPIADVMSWQGVDWLFRETRIEEEQPEAMLDALKIPKGASVADVGAGAGYHSMRMARRVGPKGTVYAVDIQPEMIRMLKLNARRARLTNIKPVLATQTDSKLPDAQIDLILMVDVYHECSEPDKTLQGLRKALKPGGRLVLVEFRGEDPGVPIKPEHKMTLKQVRLEVEPQGFAFKDSLEFLPWQHVIIFEKPAEPARNNDGSLKSTEAEADPQSATVLEQRTASPER